MLKPPLGIARRWSPIAMALAASLFAVSACGSTHLSSGVTASQATTPPSAATRGASRVSGVPAYAHVVVIMMENQDYGAVIGSPEAPYLNHTLAANGTVFSHYGNVAHPSLPNYLALSGGTTFDVDNDNNPPDNMQQAKNIVDLVEAAGKTWKAYMEDMPSNGYTDDAEPYESHHNPFVYYSDIVGNPARLARDVPYTQLARDLASAATTPNYVWITPNMCHDMHDCSVRDGDAWLSQQVPLILHAQACTQSKCLLVIVWDEDEGSGHLPALIYGPSVRAGYTSAVPYNHYSLLHTIEEALGLPTLTSNDAQARPMVDAFSP